MSVVHRVIWRGQDDAVFTEEVSGETFYGTPVIASNSYALTVGLQLNHKYAFGYWYSNADNPIVAWRVAQLLPRLMWMRPQHFPYTSTINMFVEVMAGNRDSAVVNRLVPDFRDFTTETFLEEVDRIHLLWPTSHELWDMWDKLSYAKLEAFADALQQGLSQGDLPLTEGLQSRLEAHQAEVEQARQEAQNHGGGEWLNWNQGQGSPIAVVPKQPRLSVIRRKFVGRIRRSR